MFLVKLKDAERKFDVQVEGSEAFVVIDGVRGTAVEHIHEVALEQAAPDVMMRINGIGVLTCQGGEVVIYRSACQQVGLGVRVEE